MLRNKHRHITHQQSFREKTEVSPWLRRPFNRFVLRWFVNSLGLWIAAGLLSESISYNNRFGVVIAAGLILSIINSVLKPFLIILALPAIVFSLGLFMIVVNGFTLFLVTKFYDQLQISNFGAAILAGMVIGLVNYLVTTIVEDYQK